MIETSHYKLKVQSKGEELQSTRSQLSMIETDLQAAEKERDGLAKKVEMLERALESPGSKLALRRILERYVVRQKDMCVLCVLSI